MYALIALLSERRAGGASADSESMTIRGGGNGAARNGTGHPHEIPPQPFVSQADAAVDRGCLLCVAGAMRRRDGDPTRTRKRVPCRAR